METVFTLRATAQQVDNTLSQWFADTAGSPARWQILVLLWASMGAGVAHKDVVEGLGVTRATVSGLMAGLERDGLVQSTTDPYDRRKLRVTLTPGGEAMMGEAIDAQRARFRTVFAALSPAELASLTTMLDRVREGFAATASSARR